MPIEIDRELKDPDGGRVLVTVTFDNDEEADGVPVTLTVSGEDYTETVDHPAVGSPWLVALPSTGQVMPPGEYTVTVGDESATVTLDSLVGTAVGQAEVSPGAVAGEAGTGKAG